MTTLVLTLCIGATTSALAQTSLSLLEYKVSLWPEYDQASMLVIYRGQVDQTTPGPAALRLQIPASASASLQVAYSENGQLLNVDHTDTVNGTKMDINFTTPNGSFQIEYYDTSLDLSTPNRHFTFTGVTPYPVENLILEAQQPAGAGDLTTTPPLGNPIPGPDGLTYQTLLKSNVPANDPIKVDVSYRKTTSLLTVNNPNPQATPEPEQSPNTSLYGLVGLGVVLLVIGGLIWFAARPRLRQKGNNRGSGRKPGNSKPKPASTDKGKQPSGSLASGGEVFCHECGQKSQPGDVFCRNCGATLRRSKSS